MGWKGNRKREGNIGRYEERVKVGREKGKKEEREYG